MKDLEADIDNALDRYHQLIENLEQYPEWKDRTVQDVGKWFHLIHNNLAESATKRKIFSQMVPISLDRIVRSISFD